MLLLNKKVLSISAFHSRLGSGTKSDIESLLDTTSTNTSIKLQFYVYEIGQCDANLKSKFKYVFDDETWRINVKMAPEET